MSTGSKGNVALWIVTGLVALTFVITGSSKLLAIPPSPENFARWGFSPAFMVAIGAVELIGGIALLVPRISAVAAILLMGTMAGAIRTGIVYREPLHIFLPLVLICLLAIVAVGRRGSLLRLLKRP